MLPPKTLRYQGQLYVLAAIGRREDSPRFHSGPFHGNWNADQQDAAELLKTLKELGVRARSVESGYVDHRLILIHQDDFSKALRVLKDYAVPGGVGARNALKQFFQTFKSQYKLK